MMATPEENTAGIDEARRALDEARRSRSSVSGLLREASELFDAARATRERNHFADKIRESIRGAAS